MAVFKVTTTGLKSGLVALVLILSGCGGGGGGSGTSSVAVSSTSSSSSSASSDPASSSSSTSSQSSIVSSSTTSSSSSVSSSSASAGPDSVILSGTLSYDFVPVTISGLDYDATEARPIRGAVVNLLGSNGQILQTTDSGINGEYRFEVEANTQVKVQVEARSFRSGNPSWHLRVEDNTSGNALYVLEGGLASSGETDSTRNLRAASGWAGSGYSQPRAAAPFAILDTTYGVLLQLLEVDPQLSLPVSNFRWSPLNQPAEGSLAEGEIGTSFYFASNLYILGDEDTDTDEYDRHVIAHEWSHYLEDKLVDRQDSIGGSHGQSDKLDLRVAFSEGFANAIAAYVLDDPDYIDTSGFGQRAAGGFDIASANISNPGWFSESSVQSILYNFAITSGGFNAIYEVLTHTSYANVDAHLSVFTFADRLQSLAPANYAAFEPLYTAQDINSTDPFGALETNDGDTQGVLPIYGDIQGDGSVVNVCSTQVNGYYNKLGVWKFLKVHFDSPGEYRLTVERASAPASRVTDPDFIVSTRGVYVSIGESVEEDRETNTFFLNQGAEYLVSLYDYTEYDQVSVPTCFDVTLEPVL